MQPHDTVIGITCSIFEREIERLVGEGRLSLAIRRLDSLLHIYPERLHQQLREAVQAELDAGRRVLLIYGECHAHMSSFAANPRVHRIGAMNCIEAFLGKERYRALRKQGVFFLLPEWTLRWREIFANELGLSERNARCLMQEMHSRIIYLDTGCRPVPSRELEEISTYTGLDSEVLSIGLDCLLEAISRQLEGDWER